MVKISDSSFVAMPDSIRKDSNEIYAIQVKNGKPFFIGWLEKWTNDSSFDMSTDMDKSMLNIAEITKGKPLFDCIMNIPHLKTCRYLAGDKNINIYKEFLSQITSVTDNDKCDIFCIISPELKHVINSLKDGNYVFIDFPA